MHVDPWTLVGWVVFVLLSAWACLIPFAVFVWIRAHNRHVAFMEGVRSERRRGVRVPPPRPVGSPPPAKPTR